MSIRGLGMGVEPVDRPRTPPGLPPDVLPEGFDVSAPSPSNISIRELDLVGDRASVSLSPSSHSPCNKRPRSPSPPPTSDHLTHSDDRAVSLEPHALGPSLYKKRRQGDTPSSLQRPALPGPQAPIERLRSLLRPLPHVRDLSRKRAGSPHGFHARCSTPGSAGSSAGVQEMPSERGTSGNAIGDGCKGSDEDHDIRALIDREFEALDREGTESAAAAVRRSKRPASPQTSRPIAKRAKVAPRDSENAVSAGGEVESQGESRTGKRWRQQRRRARKREAEFTARAQRTTGVSSKTTHEALVGVPTVNLPVSEQTATVRRPPLTPPLDDEHERPSALLTAAVHRPPTPPLDRHAAAHALFDAVDMGNIVLAFPGMDRLEDSQAVKMTFDLSSLGDSLDDTTEQSIGGGTARLDIDIEEARASPKRSSWVELCYSTPAGGSGDPSTLQGQIRRTSCGVLRAPLQQSSASSEEIRVSDPVV